VPWVAGAGGHDARRFSRRCYPNARPEIAEIPRVLEQDDRADVIREDLMSCVSRTYGNRRKASLRGAGHQGREGSLRNGERGFKQAIAQVWRELVGQLIKLHFVCNDDLLEIGSEAHRVLDSVEALQHHKFGIAPRRAKAFGECRFG
jgi:hypothetical protein